MAGRIRSIKPELRDHLPFASMTDGARVLFLMLYTMVDDEGRCPASAAFLAGNVFFARPRSPAVVGRMLAEIEAAGLVMTYISGGAPYLVIDGFREHGAVTHQRIEKPQPARFPAPGPIHSGNDSRNDSRNDSGTDQDHRPGPQTRTTDQGELALSRSAGSLPGQVIPPEAAHEPDRDLPEDQEHATATRSPERSDAQLAMEAFAERFEATYDGKCTRGPKQYGQVKRLVVEHGLAEVKRRIGILFDSPPPWLRPPHDVGTLAQHFDKLVAPAGARQTTTTNGRAAPADAAAHARDAAALAAGERF